MCRCAWAPPCSFRGRSACPPRFPPAAQVIVRCRPLNERERREGHREAVRVEGKAVAVSEGCPRPAARPRAAC